MSQPESESEKKTDDESDKKEHASGEGPDDQKKNDKDSSNGAKSDEKDKPKKAPVYRKPAFIITVAVVFLILLIGGIIIWLFARQYVSTDDAYIDGHVVQISPQISARVLALHIEDNQFVHKGDLLVRLDPTDYQAVVDQQKAQIISARGRLEQARAQLVSAETGVPEAEARERSARASFDNASKDLERFQRVDERARSRQQLDNAATAQTNAQAQLEQAHAQVATARANVITAQAAIKAAEGELQTAEANANRAEIDLSYCNIIAPIDGRITQRTVEAGNYVTTGQALFLVVDPNVWITANFKETQLTHLQPGQPVTIKVDAFPGMKLQGRVDSIQAGSGSRFSVLPAENATGNYVKIVQRVPVKIVFEHDANTNNAPMLSPGLSVIPRVKVR